MLKRPKIIFCQNDAAIKRRMKAVGVYARMKALKRPGETIAMIKQDEVFIWHGTLGDSGYSMVKSSSPGDLLLAATLASTNIEISNGGWRKDSFVSGANGFPVNLS